jgi:hypothetical protein
VVAVNAADRPVELELRVPGVNDGELVDVLDGGVTFAARAGRARIELRACWGRILKWIPAA